MKGTAIAGTRNEKLVIWYATIFIKSHYTNRFENNRWQRRICTLSVQLLYSDVTSVNSVFVCDKVINNSDNFRIKCLSHSKISAIKCILYFLFLHFFIYSWKTCQLMWGNFLLYLTLVTSRIIGSFLCYHLMFLIIYLPLYT